MVAGLAVCVWWGGEYRRGGSRSAGLVTGEGGSDSRLPWWAGLSSLSLFVEVSQTVHFLLCVCVGCGVNGGVSFCTDLRRPVFESKSGDHRVRRSLMTW